LIETNLETNAKTLINQVRGRTDPEPSRSIRTGLSNVKHRVIFRIHWGKSFRDNVTSSHSPNE
jgi:hypothetical protein